MATKRKTDDTISKTIDTITEKTKVVNDSAINTSHQFLDYAFDKAEKWQDIFAQTLETGVAYFGVQQDRLLTKLEGFKAQYDKGENPLADIFSFKSTDLPAAPAEVLDKTVAKAKKAAKKASKTTKAATKKVNAVKSKAKKEVTAAQKTVKSKVAQTSKAATKKANDLKSKVEKEVTTVGKAVESKVAKTSKTATKAVKTTAQKATTTAAKVVAKVTAKDDLKKVNGIGPKMEQILNAAGINTFAQLAEASTKQLKDVLLSAGPRYKSFDPSTWTKQAKQLIK